MQERDVSDVNIEENVVIGKGGDRDLLVDIIKPGNVSSPVPGILFLPGGGWRRADRTPLTERYGLGLAKHGYVCVAGEYRVMDEAPWPAQIQDVKATIRWMRANAVSYGIDPDRIAIGGHSAGAIVSLGVAYAEHGATAEVQAVMSLSGAMYGQESLIDAGEAPLIMIHGTDDLIVPYALGLAVQAAALLAPIQIEFHTLSGVGHDVPAQLDTWLVDGVTLAVKIGDFVYQALGLAPAAVPVAGHMGWAALCLILAAVGAAATAKGASLPGSDA